MSGGSLDYAYIRVEDTARDVCIRAKTPLQRAFGAHLLKVAKALHDLEWVMSDDYGPGDEVEAIRACITPAMELEAATEHARAALAELQSVIDGART
jgi:hypothetical protein